jgi:hypothetical protein
MSMQPQSRSGLARPIQPLVEGHDVSRRIDEFLARCLARTPFVVVDLFCRILVHTGHAVWPLTRKFGCSHEMAVHLVKYVKAPGLRPVGLLRVQWLRIAAGTGQRRFCRLPDGGRGKLCLGGVQWF